MVNPTQIKIAFIGGGNMASAMLSGLIHNGLEPKNLLAIDPSASARDLLITKYQITTQADLRSSKSFLHSASLIVLSIKPQQMQEALNELRTVLQEFSDCQPLILSIVAGVRLGDIEKYVGNARIVRAMPNTPALIQKGVTGLFRGKSVNEADVQLIEVVNHAVGHFVWVDQEELLDVVTALSGSGPAYVFSMIENLIESACSLGLTYDQAKLLATQTVIGAGELAHQSLESPSILREKVTSKGGTTFAALEILREKQWGQSLQSAVIAAAKRAKELGDEFSQK
jgi:pyrroline-5-carboxylate reductase